MGCQIDRQCISSPTDLALSNHTILALRVLLENQPPGTIVGQLTGSDPDAEKHA